MLDYSNYCQLEGDMNAAVFFNLNLVEAVIT
jgi:hypothetical protein